jgi:transcriptional regulator with XRE-family HTH domain
MSHWGENIRFLRKRAHLSQEAMATSLNMTRVKLNAHESGRTGNPTAIDLASVSDHFGICIDLLIRTRLSELREEELVELDKPRADLRVLAITVDERNDEYIDYVPVKAKAGYLAGHRDPEYIAALPKYRFPDLPKGKTFRLFPTSGDSMTPVPDGSDVLASYVEDWPAIKPGTMCIVVMRGEQEFVFKQVAVLNNGRLQLKSLNEQYAPYEVKSSEVLEIWAFDRYISRVLPMQRTELDEIKSLLLDLRRELKTK